MTEVFFYHGAADKISAACELLAKASVQKKRLLVYIPDQRLAEQLDRMLWTQSAQGFFPHCPAASPLAAETPILLTQSLAQPPTTERLMNLGSDLPDGFERFERLIEVVGTGEDDRQAARLRVGHYKAAGCAIRYFDLGQN